MAIRTFPHGPLAQLASNLWLVSAQTSQGLDRKMCVVRGEGGELFLVDALWLDERTFAELDALGPVRTVFVPSWLHDFDGERFAQRYPEARLCAMPATVERLRWPGLTAFEPAMTPTCMTVGSIPGVRPIEVSCEVTHPEGGRSLIYNDALFNLPHQPGARGWLLRFLGSSGPLHMSPIGRMTLLTDRAAFRAHLAQQAARADVRRVIVAHGEVVSERVQEQLAAAAARL